ncbi:MAG TPA: MFS transporter, partial [Alphaproteobacteria bacterium]|nr:MFS transporter [Alphaproteobacteria bacterium]
LLGIGLGPYCVGLVSDASNGDLGHAILSINWVAVPIAILLLIIVVRGRADTARVVDRARRAGEVI